jgi:hypothetical protein
MAGWTLYVIDLRKSVLLVPRFARANPAYELGRPCVYVGLTCRSAQERFNQHLVGIHDAPIARKYGRRVRERECRCLREMTRQRAEKKEAAYAERLRSLGWGVWSN